MHALCGRQIRDNWWVPANALAAIPGINVRRTDGIYRIHRTRHAVVVRRRVHRACNSGTRNRTGHERAAAPAPATPPRKSRVRHRGHGKRDSENDCNYAYCFRPMHGLVPPQLRRTTPSIFQVRVKQSFERCSAARLSAGKPESCGESARSPVVFGSFLSLASS